VGLAVLPFGTANDLAAALGISLVRFGLGMGLVAAEWNAVHT
jgi:diacylglycerol kinase family enzyme